MVTDQELRHADLGDERLDRRLRLIADALTAAPEATLPAACAGMIDQTYRFLDNPRAAPDAIRAAHYADTAARLPAGPDPVLLASDTTWLDFSSRPATRGLGYATAVGQNGLFLHSTLAVTAAGLPLGLLDQTALARDPAEFGKRRTRRARATADKESGRWLDAAAACQDRLPAGTPAVFVADAEADFYDLYAAPRRPGFDLLVRADGRRRLHGEPLLLADALAAAPVWAELDIDLPRGDRPAGRTARVRVHARRVAVAVPSTHPDRARLGPVELTAVRAVEVDPPAGAEAIDWVLLSTVGLSDPAVPARLVGYYPVRWRVEGYHFTLKSGCGAERLQLQERARVERAVAVYTVVAVRLLRLAHLARHDPAGDCEAVFTPLEWRVLLGQVAAQFRAGVDAGRPPTLREAAYWVGRLGGYAGRGRTAPPPGVMVLWRGLRRLHDLVCGYVLAHAPPTGQSSVE